MRFPGLSLALFALNFLPLGCRAQAPTAGQPLPPATARRVEVLLRQKATLPPGSTVNVGTPTPSELPGYMTVPIIVMSEGKSSHPINFLLSADGKTLAQFNKFDISADPRTLVSAEGRPARGGSSSAPVTIVGFDDLECPYCARLHAEIFPAITARYGEKVRFVYKDFPLDQHPWAMRAAVDVNCLGDQSTPGYWNAVDYIHAHAGEIGQGDGTDTKDKTVNRANDQLDKLTRQQAQAAKVDMTKLDACLAKQDTAAIESSKQLGAKFGVEATPSLFINGDKIDGALPLQFIFSVIDDALRAEGVAPPAPYVAPAEGPGPVPAPGLAPAAKPSAPPA